jgi:hypothetical protein
MVERLLGNPEIKHTMTYVNETRRFKQRGYG